MASPGAAFGLETLFLALTGGGGFGPLSPADTGLLAQDIADQAAKQAF